MSFKLTYNGLIRCLFFFTFFLCLSASGQKIIDVESEPFHKPIYETDEMILINLQMDEGDTSLFHKHSSPILYITVQGAEMWLDIADGTSKTVNLPDFWIGSDNYSEDDPFVHRIAVLDDGPLNLRAVIHKQGFPKQEIHDSEEFIFSENGFAVKMDSTIHHQNRSEKINIILSGQAELKSEILEPGDYFLPGQLINNASKNFRYCAVFF